MNARNRSDVETSPDGMGRLHLAGWDDPHPLGWGGSFAASPGDSATSSSTSQPGQHDPRLVAALESYMEALRAGRPWSRGEFLAQHAEIAGELEECLSGLEFIQTAGVQFGESGEWAEVPAEPLEPRARLGDFRILREVGRGGMGVVYEAQQVSLGRRVALKILPFAAAIDPKQRQRFQIEAQAAAQLHHPHIVPIFGVGCDRGIHYYAMQFIDGLSLAAIIHDARRDRGDLDGAGLWSVPDSPVTTEEGTGLSADRDYAGRASEVPDGSGAIDPGRQSGSHVVSAPTPPSTAGGPNPAPSASGSVHPDRDFCCKVARMGAEAADALDHAHGLGILHRDIKPANLLIDPHGAVWITDFGLARFHSDFSLTGTGDVVGTLRYMSPEQAQARRGVVDQRTDIYSLGVTLYELLTLRPAFQGRDHQELLRQIATDEPVPPRRINPRIPRDLETIILKAMAKDPSHRYATAQELAADLRRFLADEPILARRPGPIERALRWGRRHWEIVTTAAAVVVVSLTISTALIWAEANKTRIQAGKARAEAEKAEAEREKAVAARNQEVAARKEVEATRNAYHAYMIESFPLIDGSAADAILQALNLARGQAGPARREEGFQTFDRWLKILQQASNLPQTDRDSQIFIGRVYTHLGYTRAMLSIAKATPKGLDPTLLAQATEDYRRSINLFEELLAASPGDPKLRRYMADATGVFGLGCCFRFANRNGEAESWYRRAIEIRRKLIRDTGPGGTKTGAAGDVAGEVGNFRRLIETVQIVAGMAEEAGRRAEVERLFRPLKDDVNALAARFPGPDYQGLRKMLAKPLMEGQSPATQDGRQMMIVNCPLALILDPEDPDANNNLAWALASVPDDPWYDAKRAVDLARKAVSQNQSSWIFWNTLGVAAFRVRDWETAADSLERSIQLNGGAGIDYFFLAMTRWHQGKRDEAHRSFDRAIAWIKRTRSGDPELRRFHAEAAKVLGLPGPQPDPATEGTPKAAMPGTRQVDSSRISGIC